MTSAVLTAIAIAAAASGATASNARPIQAHAHASSLPVVWAARRPNRYGTASVLLRFDRPVVLAARLARHG